MDLPEYERGMRQGCEAAYYRVMQAIPPYDADEHRTASLERIGQMRSHLWKRFDPPPPLGVKPRKPGDTTIAAPAAPALVPPQIGENCALCGHKRGSENSIAAANTLVRLEEREAKLLGLDAPVKVDVRLGAPPKFNVDAKSRTEAVERLSILEQRTMLYLIRKMRGEPMIPRPPMLPPPTTPNGHDPTPPPGVPPQTKP